MDDNLKLRTKNFAIAIIFLVKKLPNAFEFRIIQNQIVRSATSVGANYRAACRAKSKADFINKLKIVEEELDETVYWLEILMKISSENQKISFQNAIQESNQLLAIIVSSIKTARK
jgi:four helix bundle protein